MHIDFHSSDLYTDHFFGKKIPVEPIAHTLVTLTPLQIRGRVVTSDCVSDAKVADFTEVLVTHRGLCQPAHLPSVNTGNMIKIL